MIIRGAITSFALLVVLLSGCGTSTTSEGDVASSEASENDTQQEEQQTEDIMIPETNYYRISTPKGDMVVRLYDETPAHRDNFKKLVAQDFYDNTTFHRVIENFMIQGGDPNSKDDDPLNDGQGGPGYTVPAEIQKPLFHKKGALAAARTGDNFNPERASSGSQFYIVHGQQYNEDMLTRIEEQIAEAEPGFEFADDVREVYLTEGGTPSLDMQYTVFGELVEGFDVLDEIAGSVTPRKKGEPAHPAVTDQPADVVTMTVEPIENYSVDS